MSHWIRKSNLKVEKYLPDFFLFSHSDIQNLYGVEFINSSFDEMLESGEIQQIVERYGVPFFPPLNKN